MPDPAIDSAVSEYLAVQLPGRDYSAPVCVAEFNEQTLADEGRAAVYAFDLRPGPGCSDTTALPHYVVGGATVPNYFPAYGLSPDDAYSLHIGTRFMLEMQIGRVDAAHEPPAFRELLRSVTTSVLRGAALEAEELAGLFQCEDQLFAVYRLTIGPAPLDGGGVTQRETVCFVAGDCPPGFYRLAEHPPQVSLRLHLGKVIRAEPAERSNRETPGDCG